MDCEGRHAGEIEKKSWSQPREDLEHKAQPRKTLSICPECREELPKLGELGCRLIRDMLVKG